MELNLISYDVPIPLTPAEMAYNMQQIQDAINSGAGGGSKAERNPYVIDGDTIEFFNEDLINVTILGIERNGLNQNFTQITEAGPDQWKILFDDTLLDGETIYITYQPN